MRPGVTALVLAIGLVLTSPAFAKEYRRITIAPDVTLDVEIVATEAQGFRVRVPQGQLFISYDDVLDLEVLEAATDLRPASLVVVVDGTPQVESVLRAAWDGIDGLAVRPVETVVARGVLEGCAGDIGCEAAAIPLSGWVWVVRGTIDEGVLRLASARVGSTRQEHGAAPLSLAAPVRAAALAAIGLDGDGRAPEVLDAILGTLTPAPRANERLPTVQRSLLTGLGFVPFPGTPSLAKRDWGGFATSFLVAGAGVAGWVGLAGATTTTEPELAGMGAAGAYIVTVAANQLFAAVDVGRARVSVATVPTQGPDGVDGMQVGFRVEPPAGARW